MTCLDGLFQAENASRPRMFSGSSSVAFASGRSWLLSSPVCYPTVCWPFLAACVASRAKSGKVYYQLSVLQFFDLRLFCIVSITIDYRCDDDKKKILSWRDIVVSLRSWRLQDSKLPVINPLQALVHSQTGKKTTLHGLSIPNFSEFAFLW